MLKQIKQFFHIRTYHLDTGLFMHANANKNLLSLRDMLATMDCDNLTRKDITRLADYMCISRKRFIEDFTVKDVILK